MANLQDFTVTRVRRPKSNKSILSNIRDVIWNYPVKLIPPLENLIHYIRRAYTLAKPVSGFIVVSIFLVSMLFTVQILMFNVKLNQKAEIVEGVLGVPDNLNPIYIPDFQVQKDVYGLLFNHLFHINRDGSVIGDLVENWEYRDGGKKLYMDLKNNITWHDGVPFSSSDVRFTVELFKNLDGQESFFDTVENVEVEVISAREIIFKLERASASFLETINWPILPEHLLKDIPINELEYAGFGLKPVGTGPYKFDSWRGDEIHLVVNPDYSDSQPEIEGITFKSYPSEKDLIGALLTGKIDSTASINVNYIDQVQNENWITATNVSMINRYWAVYFNFNGPEYLKDKRMRQALSAAINRNKIIKDALYEFGQESKGPIPETSWAYNADADRYDFDLEQSKNLLSDLGYSIPEGGEYLEKDGMVLEIQLSYVSNPIQDEVAENIAKDWETIGVKTNLIGLDYKTFRDTLLIPRSFETILFGVETLLDPDHFRLWHSSQISPPGRNFASYKSSYTVLEGLNRVDELLDKGRITLKQDERKDTYKRFQNYLFDEVPAAFLYHPAFVYVYNNRIKDINVSNIVVPEDRFVGISNWEITR